MVFISYSQESEVHVQRVIALADMLRGSGIDAMIDRYVANPPAGWAQWSARQIKNAEHVLCVCTATYRARFEGDIEEAGFGVAWEGSHISNDIYRRRAHTGKYLAIAFGSLSVDDIPECLQGASRYAISSQSAYDELRDYLLGVNPYAPPPLGNAFDTPRAPLTLEFRGNGAPEVKTKPRALVVNEDVAARVASGDCSLLRLTFDHLGDSQYRVSVARRAGAGQSFEHDVIEIAIESDIGEAWATISAEHQIFAMLSDALHQGRPTRLQIQFSRSVKALDQFNWEGALFEDQPLHDIPQIVLSRSFVLQDGEAPEIRVSPKSELDFTQMTVRAYPAQLHAHDIRNGALRPSLDLAARLASAFPTQIEYGQRINGDPAQTLRMTDVLFLPLVIAASQGNPRQSSLVLPSENGSLGYMTPFQFVSMLSRLPERPIVLFLAPANWNNQNAGVMFEFSRRVARECAAAGVASVVSLAGAADLDDWLAFVAVCADELKRSGIVDAAVAAALHSHKVLAGSIRLYLRNKSARLWYHAGLVSSGFRADWSRLREAFARQPDQNICAVLGPGIDRKLKLSRRVIARQMALVNGFSLSAKDEENLARVAEYIRVRGGPSDASGSPPHVAAFVSEVRQYLLRHVSPHQQSALADAPIGAIALATGQHRIDQVDSPYQQLAKLRSSCLVTTNFHSLIEDSLRREGRRPIVGSFRRDWATEPNEDLVNPIVYHAFGSFDDERNMAIAESDHLDFLSEFVDDQSSTVLRKIRANLLGSPLLFMGFHPESWEFRVLFAALTRMPGASAALYNVHIAVQVDPEDDHIIDSDDARHFYEGLLSPLGEHVYVYWGRTDQFLTELQHNVPSLFLKDGELQAAPQKVAS